MLEGFKNIKPIGSGGFGNVYVAEEELSGKKMAIKKIRANLLVDEYLILNEIKTISKFNHPNIVNNVLCHESNNQTLALLLV